MTRYQFLGHLVYYLMSILYKTLRIKIVTPIGYEHQKPYLFCSWHGKQFLPVFEIINHLHTKSIVMASPSRDGEILATCLKNLGYEVLRGSSRKNNVSALVHMMRKLKQGYSLGFAIDGPIGPIYKVKPGMTHMAQKVGIEIIPLGTAFQSKWVAEKAWDKFEIPKPFSKAVHYLGEPIFVDKDADLDHYNSLLEQRIHEANAKAYEELKKF